MTSIRRKRVEILTRQRLVDDNPIRFAFRIRGPFGRLTFFSLLLLPFFAQAESLTDTIINQLYPWAKYSYRNNSDTPLEILLGPKSVEIAVPKAYIDALFPPDNGKDGIMMEGYLPDLEPRTVYWSAHPDLHVSDGQSPQKIAFRKALVQIQIYGSYMGPQDPTGQASLNQQCQDEKRISTINRSISTSEYNEFDMNNGSSLYFYKGQNPYFERCESGTCSILYIYKGKIRVNVEFSDDNLSHSGSIIYLVTTFLNSIT